MRNISRLSYDILTAPASGFTDVELLSSREMMNVAIDQPLSSLELLAAQRDGEIELIGKMQVLAFAPFLNSDKLVGGVYEQAIQDIGALYHGFLKAFSRFGGLFKLGLPVAGLLKNRRIWAFVRS